MSRKLTIEFIRQQFVNDGYELLSKEYLNSSIKLKYRCPNGHTHKISWDKWKQGQRCYYCNGNIKKSLLFIKSDFEKHGYELLSIEYKNNRQKLKYVCPNGHIHSITWRDWISGNRCYYCSKTKKPTIEFVRKSFELKGYKLLSSYIDSRQKLKFICPAGHKHDISWDNWKAGKRRLICSIINKSGSKHPNWKGGISCEPYCDAWADKEYKESIKERDGYRCLNPCCKGVSKRLAIHHIDYNKQNCAPSNLITLCTSCNSMANKDRSWHKQWYVEILKKRGIYKHEI